MSTLWVGLGVRLESEGFLETPANRGNPSVGVLQAEPRPSGSVPPGVRINLAVTYLITFAGYGCRLHGDATGSVDRWHHTPGTPIVEEHLARAAFEEGRMDQPPYHLDPTRREAVWQAIQGVCAHRGWNLLAAHVRSNHVHAVVEAEAPPERIMNDFKAYASRHLNWMGLDEPRRKRWARHGSTRWLWKPPQVSAAIQYVVAEQGDAMSVFEAQES